MDWSGAKCPPYAKKYVKSSSEKSKILSSTSKNVDKTYQNLVKYDEPHVKKEFVNDCFLAGNDN